MKVPATDRESIETGLPVSTLYVVISIRDADKRKARVRRQPGLEANWGP